MKGKPIEPGCLAIIIYNGKCPQNVGRVVRVLRKIGARESFILPTTPPLHVTNPGVENTWMVEADEPLAVWRKPNQFRETKQRPIAGRYLIRIDDGEDHSIDTAQDQPITEKA